MPGITGIISRNSPEECACIVARMTGSMIHEPFYTSGTHADPELGIYAGWVGLGDKRGPEQLFADPHSGVTLLFSGECFSEEQRVPETGSADSFQLRSLVRLYEDQGDRVLETMNGLFSALLIDRRQRRALLFTDRYGIERIYFHESKDAFYFASEVKALLEVAPGLRAFDEEGVAEFLTFGCTLEGRTLFKGVRFLPAGSLLTFQNREFRQRRYFSPEVWEQQDVLSPDEFEMAFDQTFGKVAPRYFGGGSKIGISLTGGLDTRMLMACRPSLKTEPRCYTFAGVQKTTLDARLAGQVAGVCGLSHDILRLEDDFFSDFATHADRTVHITDGSFGVLGAHEIYLNRQARNIAAVRLTGVFGGEILRGVSTFKPLQLLPALLQPELHMRVCRLERTSFPRRRHAVTFATSAEIPWNIYGSLAACRSQVRFRTPYLDNEIVALAFRAPECSRDPSSAWRLVQRRHPVLCNIPTDMGQGPGQGLTSVLQRLWSRFTFKLDYLHNDGLPKSLAAIDAVIKRVESRVPFLGLHKYLHYRRWLGRELAPHVSAVLGDTRVRQSCFWNRKFVEQLAAAQIAGRNFTREIDAVLTLEAVERLLFRNKAHAIHFREQAGKTPACKAL